MIDSESRLQDRAIPLGGNYQCVHTEGETQDR